MIVGIRKNISEESPYGTTGKNVGDHGETNLQFPKYCLNIQKDKTNVPIIHTIRRQMRPKRGGSRSPWNSSLCLRVLWPW